MLALVIIKSNTLYCIRERMVFWYIMLSQVDSYIGKQCIMTPTSHHMQKATFFLFIYLFIYFW
jgi:hypothetical protein